ncbi:hypothetical protein UFOVP1437_10 [uncultured Caudovirales phage]|uniref:Bacteriophage P22, Gp10, DNA-stabilising n=1 Tax=uncultured Caudovirales phage TaxID=2100421 RepID=A0A6J7XDH1_9CAUD|nr:hypothetical protein UFOVP1437_10 [uncultured Caudovirales phage]CAB5228160.1 hypothetical protein UFOVP1531_54 [uncultured Caudovirales phage]
MGERKVVPFLVPTYQQKGLKLVGQQRLKNCYFHMTPGMVDGRGQYSVLSAPGYLDTVTISGTTVRACISYNNVGYAVVDDKLKKITSAFAVSDLGVTLGGSTGMATMAATGTEVVVCANSKIYRINTSTDVVTDITAVLTAINALNIPLVVMSQNKRFIYITSNASQVHISAIYNCNAITSLDGFIPNTIAGTLSAGAVTTWYQYYFNENAVEVFRDTGAEIGPFARVDGGAVPVGIAASSSALSIMNKVYYLGRTTNGLLGVVELDGTNYKVVSTPDFVETINSYYSYTDALAWTDTHNGHIFYNLTFPTKELAPGYSTSTGITWSYDLTTNLWFVRTSYDAELDRETRHTANCSMYLGNKQLIGSAADANFKEISTNYYDEDDVEINREVITATLIDRDSFFSIYNLEIDIERGIGLTSGQGSSPQIMIEISKDKNNTWSSPIVRTAGASGQYKTIVRVGSCGGGKSFTLRLKMTDPVAWAIAGITAEIEGSVD